MKGESVPVRIVDSINDEVCAAVDNAEMHGACLARMDILGLIVSYLCAMQTLRDEDTNEMEFVLVSLYNTIHQSLPMTRRAMLDRGVPLPLAENAREILARCGKLQVDDLINIEDVDWDFLTKLIERAK